MQIPRVNVSCLLTFSLLILTTVGVFYFLYLIRPEPEPRHKFHPVQSTSGGFKLRVQAWKDTPLHKEIHKSLNVLGTILQWKDDYICNDIVNVNASLNLEDIERSARCIAEEPENYKKDIIGFWSGSNQWVRHNHHTYLNKDSLVVDVGGNIGLDAQAIINKFHPKTYIILEPVPNFYNGLVNTFKDNPDVSVFNFGLAAGKGKLNVKEEKDATSIFRNVKANVAAKDITLRLENTTEFFTMLGIGCFDVDLLTINCEGGEYEILEAVVSSSLIRHVRHVQFATHVALEGLKDPVKRYCRLQEVLARTHTISYQYKFVWESWTRKDLV